MQQEEYVCKDLVTLCSIEWKVKVCRFMIVVTLQVGSYSFGRDILSNT